MGRTLGLLAALVGLGLLVSAANADFYTEQYEMNASPASAAGTANGNVLFVLPDAGTGTNGPTGFVFAGGIGTFLDDGNSNGNQGFYTGPTPTWLAASYTADFRIKVLQNTADIGGKSMSFWSTNGRGLQLNLGTSTFVSSGPEGTGGTGTFGEWTTCRVIINGPLNTAEFYVWDGATWVINASASMGGSGYYGGSTVGFALGSTAGSGTTLSNFQLDYFRVYSGGTEVNAVYDVKAVSSADVTPVNPKNVRVDGASASPASLVYTVTNTGTAALTITAVEVDVNGTPVTPSPWLDLGTATTGELAPDATGTITATFNTAGLTTGSYEALIKFTDSVSINEIRVIRLYDDIPVPCIDETFSYPDGNLNGVGGWAGNTGSQIVVSAERALLTYDNAFRGTMLTKTLPFPVTGNTIYWYASVYHGDIALGDNAFDLRLEDAEGDSFARWYGACNTERPRIGDGGYVLNTVTLIPNQWNSLLVVIDTVAKTATFSLNGVLVPGGDGTGTLPYGVASPNTGNAVARIRMGFQNATVDQNGAFKYYNNIIVTGEQCDTVCTESLTPAGGGVSTAEEGAAAVPATHAFTVTNINSLDASYALDTVDVNGNHADFGWLSFDQALGAGPTLAPEEADVVTATVDATGLLADEYVAFLKFTNTCSSDIWYRPIKLQVLGVDCLFEKFPYMAGPLNGQPGWSGPSSAGAIDVLSDGTIQLNGSGTTDIAADHETGGCGCDAGELQTVSVKVRGHSGESRYWELHFLDSNGNDLVQWRGGGAQVEGYMGGFGTAPAVGNAWGTDLTGGGEFDTLEATINTNDTAVSGIDPHQTRFVLISPTGARNVLGSLVQTGSGQVQSVRFRRLTNNVPDVIDFDDLIVHKCTADLCKDPVFDVRNTANEAISDGHVSSQDHNAFEACATGPGVAAELSIECKCMDLNNDDAIDQVDFAAFQRCYSGSTAAVDPACDN